MTTIVPMVNDFLDAEAQKAKISQRYPLMHLARTPNQSLHLAGAALRFFGVQCPTSGRRG
jgi:hypothetical protein